jgi:hypothetical protein
LKTSNDYICSNGFRCAEMRPTGLRRAPQNDVEDIEADESNKRIGKLYTTTGSENRAEAIDTMSE